MATKTKASGNGVVNRIVNIESVTPKRVRFRIVGTSPLLMHQFDPDDLEQMANKDNQKGGLKKVKKSDQERFEAAQYKTEDGEFYMPAPALRRALGSATTTMGDVRRFNKDKVAKTIFTTTDKLIVKSKSGPKLRVDIGRNKSKQAVRTIRAEFADWEMEVELEFDPIFGEAEVLQLVEKAGFGVGIGAWRPECKGIFGRFKVVRG